MRRACRDQLADEFVRTRQFTWRLLDRLSQPQWQVPYLETINPPLWELGHLGWFQEYWCLRQREGLSPAASMLAAADDLYDSRHVDHAERWGLRLPSLEATRDYLDQVLAATLARLDRSDGSDESLYLFRLALFHEYMHQEAFAYTWQTLGYACPDPSLKLRPFEASGALIGVSAGPAAIGSQQGDGFAFDNEQWIRRVQVERFEISSRPVTNAEFQAFVDAGGYQQAQWWAKDAFQRLQTEGRSMPVYWRRTQTGYEQRQFDCWQPLESLAPVHHVSAYEAEAWCRWAGKRLPTEAEWVRAAREAEGFDWGGCVWEWTATAFEPLAGFEPGPYREYSAPFFGTHRVVRGASVATPAGMVDDVFRNFYTPERSDIIIGFRACQGAD